jgi:hypothetical protein
MSKGVPKWFWNGLDFRPMEQEISKIEYCCQKKSTKSKLEFLGKLGCTFGIFGNPLMSGIFWS